MENGKLFRTTLTVNGLLDRILGDKFENVDFIYLLNKFDCLVLTETWSHKLIQIIVNDVMKDLRG